MTWLEREEEEEEERGRIWPWSVQAGKNRKTEGGKEGA